MNLSLINKADVSIKKRELKVCEVLLTNWVGVDLKKSLRRYSGLEFQRN